MADKASPFPFVFTPSCPDRDMSLNVVHQGQEPTKALLRQDMREGETTQSLLPWNLILTEAGPYLSRPLHEHCLLVFSQHGGLGGLWGSHFKG